MRPRPRQDARTRRRFPVADRWVPMVPASRVRPACHTAEATTTPAEKGTRPSSVRMPSGRARTRPAYETRVMGLQRVTAGRVRAGRRILVTVACTARTRQRPRRDGRHY